LSRDAWLTHDSIPARNVVAISLPDDETWRADFLGALLLLSGAENWEVYGTLTPTQMAAEWLDIFLDFVGGDTHMFPVGSIMEFAGTTQPDGWFFCNGGDIDREDYAALFAVIGTTYGVGDGSTTFNIPDLRRRGPIGLDEEDTDYDNIGTMAGSEDVTLTTSQIPAHTHIQDSHNHNQNSHNHTQNAHNHTVDGGINAASGAVGRSLIAVNLGSNNTVTRDATATNQAAVATNQATVATNQNTGGGQSHTNMQPYIILNFIIKY
jgi:microcystin-dependent protein